MAGSYLESYKKYGDSPRALKWKSYQSAARRYRELVLDLELAGKTVIDAACGMGDLLPYLCAKSLDFVYSGYDAQPEFLEIARRRYEGFDFEVADIFSEDFNKKADIVICSAALNHREEDWLEKRKSKIERLYDLCGEVLAFNMAGGFFEPYESRNIAYANTAEMLDFCKNISPKVILRSGYDPKDFTILMFKR